MKLILISADLEDIESAYALGVFVGVAGNPDVNAAAQTFHADYTARFGASEGRAG